MDKLNQFTKLERHLGKATPTQIIIQRSGVGIKQIQIHIPWYPYK